MIESDVAEKTDSFLYNKEIRSEEVREIITAVPNWILRWGITLLFGVLGFIFIGSCLY
jgi:hypothetical protein